MTTKIGGIVVDIDARLTKMEASLAKADRNLGRFEKNVKAQGSAIERSVGKIDAGFTRMAGSLAALGAAAGIAVVANLGRNVLAFADDLATAADQAGISVTRYQTLREALRSLELDTASADKVFKTLQDTLGAVQTGTDDSATKALERLGISARIMSGEITTGDQLLDALAASAETAGSKAAFTSEIVEIFGKRVGVDLAAALADGGTALHSLEQDFIDTGLVIDEQMINKLADANEVIDRFTAQTANRFAIWAADAITAFQDAGYWLDRLALKLNNVGGGPSSYGPLTGLKMAIGADGGDTAQRVKAEERRRAQNSADAMLRMLGFDVGGGSPPPAPPPRPPRTTRSGGGGSRRGSDRPVKRDPTAAELRDKAMLKIDVPPVLRGADAALVSLADIEASFGNIDGLIANLGPLPDLGKILPIEDQERIEYFALGLKNDLAAGLADAIVYGENLGDVLEDTFKRAAAAMIQSGILNFLTGGQEGTSFGTMFANVGKIFGVSKRALGGYTPPGLTLVGEEGPELVRFNRPGNVVPNHRLMQAGFGARVEPSPVRVIVDASDLLTARIVQGDHLAMAGGAARGHARVLHQASRRIP